MKRKKRLFAIIAMVLMCIGCLVGCSGEEAAEDNLDEGIKSSIATISEQNLQGLAEYDEEYISTMIEQYEDSNNATMAGSLQTWLTTKEEVGNLVQINSTTVSMKDRQYVAVVETTFEKRPMTVTIYYDRTGAIINIEYAPYYTIGENLSRAAVHTLIGMGTVFIVLIFISMIIGCFKYINEWEKQNAQAKTAKAAPVPVSAPAVLPAPEQEAGGEAEFIDETDDLELVAVITAAIAASANTSADGLVVRSIRRKSGAKWKRA